MERGSKEAVSLCQIWEDLEKLLFKTDAWGSLPAWTQQHAGVHSAQIPAATAAPEALGKSSAAFVVQETSSCQIPKREW